MNNNIECYHTQREWKTYKLENEKTNLTIGFELEVENYGNKDNNEVAGIVKDMLNGFVEIERDGSLNNGFEIISHPFTRKYFETIKPQLKQVFDYLNTSNFKGDETQTAGLHVHINRMAFGEDFNQNNKNINKLFLFFETYKNELIKFSRRHTDRLTRWATFFSDAWESRSARENEKKLKSTNFINARKDANERYRAINLCNKNTIEIRIFKSSLNFETFCATLELVFSIMENINGNLSKLSWNNIINSKNNYDLFNYCVRRNIADNNNKLIDYSLYLERVQTSQRKQYLTAFNRITKYLNYINDHQLSYFNKLINNNDLKKSTTFSNFQQLNASLERRITTMQEEFNDQFYDVSSNFLRYNLQEITGVLAKYETHINDERASVHLKNIMKEFEKIRQLKEVI